MFKWARRTVSFLKKGKKQLPDNEVSLKDFRKQFTKGEKSRAIANQSSDGLSVSKVESSDSEDDYMDPSQEQKQLDLIKGNSNIITPKIGQPVEKGKLNSSLKTKLISIRKQVILKKPYYVMEKDDLIK